MVRGDKKGRFRIKMVHGYGCKILERLKKGKMGEVSWWVRHGIHEKTKKGSWFMVENSKKGKMV
jgi:hypothetical protein